jgi:hypothetical protein
MAAVMMMRAIHQGTGRHGDAQADRKDHAEEHAELDVHFVSFRGGVSGRTYPIWAFRNLRPLTGKAS